MKLEKPSKLLKEYDFNIVNTALTSSDANSKQKT